jgi:hypothetical protein
MGGAEKSPDCPKNKEEHAARFQTSAVRELTLGLGQVGASSGFFGGALNYIVEAAL